MPTYIFQIGYKNEKSDIYDVNNLFFVGSSSYKTADSYKKTYNFYANFNISKASKNTRLFTLSNKIIFSDNVFNFNLKYILNKDNYIKTYNFYSSYSILKVLKENINTNFKFKIETEENIQPLKQFNLGFKLERLKLNTKIYAFPYDIYKNSPITKTFNLSYNIETNRVVNESFTIDYVNNIDFINYSIDKDNLGIGNLHDILNNTLEDDIVLYIVIFNGAIRPFNIYKITITEQNKSSLIHSDDLLFLLTENEGMLGLEVDKNSPFSIKVFKG